MRTSDFLANTLREVPTEAEIISHQLLLRAGYIKKVASGIYSYLPLGWRVMKKLMTIIRQEMDNAGGLEVYLPTIHPAELWMETGRWDVYGDELFRLQDRHHRNFCLGPTHEEVITDLIRREISSYKQLPLMLYQIQNKFRDERRPRFGLMRGREFLMKDLYSFDKNQDDLDSSYHKMYKAYDKIFTRCGLKFRPVEADTGAIGGSISHEFMVMADNGEQEIVYCSKCDYAANIEKAEAKPQIPPEETQKNLEKVPTPATKTIEQLIDYLGVEGSKTLKTMVYDADGELVAVLLRGDRTINEIKLKNFLGCNNLQVADEDLIKEKTDLSLGYIGPIGIESKIRVIADLEVKHLINVVAGANEDGYHFLNVNPQRDFTIKAEGDFRVAEEGETCCHCDGILNTARGIEVGQIFQLGTKYSESLKAYYTDEAGNNKPILMGCYGIGVGRTMAASIEQNYDNDGIIWPMSLAPFHAIIIPISMKNQDQLNLSEKIYRKLSQQGLEVVLDDRDERAGVKFKDADLVGYPIKIIIGKQSVTEDIIEIALRLKTNKQRLLLKTEKAIKYVCEKINEELALFS